MGTWDPSAASTVAFIDSEYLVPSLKMWPTSSALKTSSVPSQAGHPSPARTFRRSATLPWRRRSRSTSTPSRWKSFSFAPVTIPEAPRSVPSTKTAAFEKPTAPSDPASAPISGRISSGWAGRSACAPVAVWSFASFSSSSPRTTASTGVPSPT